MCKARASVVILAVVVLLCPRLAAPLRAQDAEIGVAMPVTITGEVLATHRLQTFDPGDSNVVAGFRAMAYPSLTLGPHWFAYSAIQWDSQPFFYYDTYYPTRDQGVSVLQAFGGYATHSGDRAFTFKVGQLPSAFGSFPLRYDDTENPLLDLPLNYGAYIGLRADQLPCGVPDLLKQRSYAFIQFSCGGETSEEYGLWTANLYGLLGTEIDLSWARVDARLQITNSSPVYPHSLFSDGQHPQWTAGVGYTIRQGFRVGFSAFRGPFMTDDVADLLPIGKSVSDYPATGAGIDAQWAGGRWSTSGEWQWNQFQYPGFVVAPAVQSAYAEVKTILTPRFYAAFRGSFRWYNRPEDALEQSPGPFQPSLQQYEFALGFHVDHFQTFKVGYEWLRTAGLSGTNDNVLGMQFVTSIDSLSKAIR